MSSYPYFQHFRTLACLDNFVSGIPNAIISPLFGGRNGPRQAWIGVCDHRKMPIAGTQAYSAQAIMVLMPHALPTN
jgi:hypothetical protein